MAKTEAANPAAPRHREFCRVMGHHCDEIDALEAENSIQRDVLTAQTNSIDRLEAERDALKAELQDWFEVSTNHQKKHIAYRIQAREREGGA